MIELMSNKKIVGYCRVSTEEQKKKGFGIDIQVGEIEQFAKVNNIKVDCIFKDSGAAVSPYARTTKFCPAYRVGNENTHNTEA